MPRNRKEQQKSLRRMPVAQFIQFISIWREFIPRLKNARKNADVYQEMQLKLKEAGIDLQLNEIRNRIYNITKSYRAGRRKVRDGLPPDWKHYSLLDEIMGSYEKDYGLEFDEDINEEPSPDHQVDIDGMCLEEDESQPEPGSNLDGFIVEEMIKEEFEYEDSNQESGFSSSTPHPTQHDHSPTAFNRPEPDDNVSSAHVPLPASSGTTVKSAKKRKKNSCDADYNMLLAIKESIEEVGDFERERNEIERQRNEILKEYSESVTDSLVRMTDAQEELLGLIRISMSSRNSN